MPETEPGRRRGSLGATVAVGVVAAGAAAIAGNQSWATVGDTGDQLGGSVATLAVAADRAEAPLVTAVALVVLATWGVVLVTRGRFRRVMTWFGMLAAVGLLVATVVTFWEAPAAIREAFELYAVTEADVQRTWWSWLAGAGAVLAVLAAWVAVREAPLWPEMGKRYDAPGTDTSDAGAGAEADDDDSERSSIDLWKSIDEGRDPSVERDDS